MLNRRSSFNVYGHGYPFGPWLGPDALPFPRGPHQERERKSPSERLQLHGLWRPWELLQPAEAAASVGSL